MKTLYAFHDIEVDAGTYYEDHGPVLRLDVFTYMEGRDPAARLEGVISLDRAGAVGLREQIEAYLAELDGCV